MACISDATCCAVASVGAEAELQVAQELSAMLSQPCMALHPCTALVAKQKAMLAPQKPAKKALNKARKRKWLLAAAAAQQGRAEGQMAGNF